jgi:hypothetical protein
MERLEVPFRNNLVKELRSLGYFAYAIESESTGDGIADAYALIHKRPIWMECKYEKEEHVFSRQIKFRPGQERFLKQHFEEGGYGLIVIRTPESIYFSSIEYVEDKRIEAKHAFKINRLCYLPLAVSWMDAL